MLKNRFLIKKISLIIFAFFFSVIAYLILYLIFAIMIFQFVYECFYNQNNKKLAKVSHKICVYLFQIIKFLTSNSNSKPFPFGKFPEDGI